MTKQQKRIWTAVFADIAVLIGQLDPTWSPEGLDKPAALEQTRQNLIILWREALKVWPAQRPAIIPTERGTV